MMNWKVLMPWVLIVIIILFVVVNESLDSFQSPIITPSKENSKTITEPTQIIEYDTIEVENKGKTEIKIVEKENPINQELLRKYEALKDSVARLNLYKEVITERKYKETLDDSLQTITIDSEVIGTLKKQTISYKTKPQIKKPKKSKLHTYLGVTTNIPTNNFGRFAVGGQFSIKHQKRIYSLGYNTNEEVIATLQIQLFN